MKRKLRMGVVVVTSCAQNLLDPRSITVAIQRHESCNCGIVCSDVWADNDWSLEHGGRILSSYEDANGVNFSIITERDRSVKTVLFPEEY